ncbi:MAG TPA: hypothetical protein VFM84_05250 [Holophagaceae bacterium]|nr:hypothetical protein [Holophagaceae bacterium]
MRDGQDRLKMKRNLAIAEKQTHPGKDEYLAIQKQYQDVCFIIYIVMVEQLKRHCWVTISDRSPSIPVTEDGVGPTDP